MNRRDFFKLGIGGLGAVAGGILASEAKSTLSSYGGKFHGHPWWVRMIDKPKLAIDAQVYSPFDAKKNVFGSFAEYYGMENLRELQRKSREKTMKYFQGNRPGYRLEDRALADAGWVVSRLGGLNRGTRSWNRRFVSTPESRGVKKYSGTPKEAARLVKTAARYFGAAKAGITILDKRHIHSMESGKKMLRC